MAISFKRLLRQYREPWSKVFYKAFRQWRADKMEETRMVFTDIGSSSIVFDVGGFEGNWAADIHTLYGSYVHIFEPHPVFADKIDQRFKGKESYILHPFALGSSAGTLTLSDDGDASSSFRETQNSVVGQIVPVDQFFENHDISNIDLMKVNIEGGEYDLLPALVNANIMPRIKLLQVQFHLYSAEDVERRDAIRQMLEKTHTCDWSYDFVWEQWSLRT